ncbi:hypothetical protein ACHRVZ_15165 [Flavobacterium sp. FlaQc-57]|uniref:hypothetical protein n=1 Tax=Flavobacterium sp. FlaQc-57 TaxID=3374186 RepID=UPI003757DB70
MKKQNIEDIFSSMEDFSSVPPPELWGQIEEKLDKPKKKKRAILWWSAAACLLLGLLLPSVLHFNSTSGIKTIQNSAVENNSVVLDEKKDNLNTNKAIADPENNSEKITPEQKSIVVDDNNSSVNNTNQSDNSKENQKTAVASSVKENSFKSKPANTFNSSSKNPVLSNDIKAANKALAEKTFNSGKTNSFNSNSRNKLSNSIFEDKLTSKNGNNIAFNSSNSFLNENQKATDKNAVKQKNENVFPSKEIASNQTSNSKFKDVLSKQDSVQLAELQNLEKGIVIAENPSEKKNKATSKAEKWAVEVFAGVANSENYKNDKTLGNVNESKQGSTYGVKTKYKINKKWAVGSGFKINELGQSIANISYMGTKNTALLSSSDYFNQNITTATPQISTNSGYVFVSTVTTNALKQNNIQSNNIQTGNLDQSLRYVEMPLEVSYAIFTKNKASINLNTGGFVGKLISNNMALDGNSIGENVNANDFVYGSTLSSTIQYRVYKKTNVFVEPAMNYYMNPLNNQSFNQFQWGLNFGLNVSF